MPKLMAIIKTTTTTTLELSRKLLTWLLTLGRETKERNNQQQK